MTKKENFIVWLIFSGICIIALIVGVARDNSEHNQIFKKYPYISKSDSISNVVTEIHHFGKLRENVNVAFVTLDNGSMYRIYTYPLEDQKTRYLDENLKEGDCIFKDFNSSSLLIMKLNNDDTNFVSYQLKYDE